MKKPTLCPDCGSDTTVKEVGRTYWYTCTNTDKCGKMFTKNKTKKKNDAITQSRCIKKVDTKKHYRHGGRKPFSTENKERIVKAYKGFLRCGIKKTKAKHLVEKEYHHSIVIIRKVLKEYGLMNLEPGKEKSAPPEPTPESTPEPEKTAEGTTFYIKLPTMKNDWLEFIKKMTVQGYIELKQAIKEIEGS